MMGEALAYDSEGLPVWRSVVIVAARKNGKTASLAALSLYRLLTSAGRPEILLAAASDKQAGRLFDAAARFVRRSPELSGLLRVRDHAGEIVREDGMGIIYRLSSDPTRLYGYNPTDVVVDELAQWGTPNLRRAYAALTSGGGARSAPTVYTITTAGEASQRHDSILGRILDAGLAATDIDREPGLTVCRLPEARTLVYEYAAPTDDPRDVKAMKLANPASWITEAFLRRQAEDPELTDAQVLQLHGCVWAETETTFVGPSVLLAAIDQDRRLEDGERVVLAFDGSERRDETWLVAVTFDGYAEPLRRWARPAGAGDDWRIPRPEVHCAVADAFDRFDVVEFAADPPGWYSELDQWAELYGDRVVMFDTKRPSDMAPAAERTRSALNDGTLRFGGPLAGKLAEHFGNCVAVETAYGVVPRKAHPDSARRIDGAVAAIVGFARAAVATPVSVWVGWGDEA